MTSWHRRRIVEICSGVLADVQAYRRNLSGCPHLASECKQTAVLQDCRITTEFCIRWSFFAMCYVWRVLVISAKWTIRDANIVVKSISRTLCNQWNSQLHTHSQTIIYFKRYSLMHYIYIYIMQLYYITLSYFNIVFFFCQLNFKSELNK